MNRRLFILIAMLFGFFLMARPAHGIVVSDRNILTPGWWNNPMYYGATGDSTADARAAIRSAYTKINDTTGGVIFFPPGVYRLSDSLIFWLDTIPNLTLQGSGYNTRIILEGVGGFHIKAATAGAGTGRFIIRDMSIWSATNQKHQYALNLENVGTFTISNVQLQGRDSLSKGVLFKGTQQGLFSSGYINQCDTAIFLDSSQGVSANSINIHSVNMTGRSGVPKGIGVLTRRVQTGVIDGYGQITNFAYGVYQIGAEGYNILNTMFETDSTAIYVASGEHTIIIGNAFYTTTKNDIYLAGGSRAQIASNLFNGKVTVGANATQPRFVGNLFSNLYTDSVTSTLNRPEFAWNHNQGSGTGPSGLKFSTATDDSLDLRIRSLGAIDARLNADSACFLRLSGAGTSSDDKWKSTTSSYRKGRMGIEFGDSVNSATAPLYAIFGSTNSANGLYVATYAGVAIDSLLPRLRISGSAATADVLFSNITNVYKAVVTADSQYVTKRYVDDSAGTGTGTDTSLALGDAATSPGDTVDWRGDSVAVNSSNDTTWIKSNDALIIDAAQVGEGAGAVIVGSDTLRADDSGLTYLGLANRPWGLFYQTQLYLLETTGTDSWIPVSRVAPSTGQPLEFDGTSWAPGTDGGSGGVTSADTSGDGTLDVTIPDSIGLYQGTNMDINYNATGRKLTFNSSGSGSDNDTSKVLSDLGTGAIDRKIEWSSQQIRIEDLTASAQVVQIIAPNDILVVGDTTGGVLRVLAQLQLFTDSATSGDVRMMLPFDTTDVAGPTNGQGFIWSSANGQFELTTLSASGTGDTLLVQIAGVDYTIINNTIKAKEAYGVDFVRHDSTGYDVWLISVDTAALPFDLYLPIAGNIPMPYPTYRFDDATADADPGNGDIRFNSATPASVTILYVDDVTIIGEGADALWNVVDTGYIVSVQQKADLAADASQYRVTGKTDAAGYWKINVTVLGSGTLPAASDTLHLTVTARDVRTGGSTDSLYVLYEADVAGETSEWHFSGDTVHVDTADATGGGGDDTVTVLGDASSAPDDRLRWDVDTLLMEDQSANAQALYFGAPYDSLQIIAKLLTVGDTLTLTDKFRITATPHFKTDTGSGYMDLPYKVNALTFDPATAGANYVYAWEPSVDSFVLQAQTGGAGEANTASNKGITADSVFYAKSGVDLQFRRLKDSTGVIITPSGDTALSFSVDTNAANIRALVIEHVDDSLNEYLLTSLFDDSLGAQVDPHIGDYIDSTTLDTIQNAHHAVSADSATEAVTDVNGAAFVVTYLHVSDFDDSLNAQIDPYIGTFIDSTTLDTIQNAHKAVLADSASKVDTTYAPLRALVIEHVDDSLNEYLLSSLFDDSVVATTAKIPTAVLADSSKKMDTTASNFTTYVANHGGAGTWVETGSGSDTSHAWKVAASDADTALLIQKVAGANTVKLHPGDLSATKVLHAYGEGGTVVGDTGSANPLRTVINNTRAMYQTEDSTRIDSAFTANRISTDSVQLGEGWIAQADGAGLVITSGVLDVVGDSTITVAAGSMTVANIPDVSVDSNKAVNGSLSSSDIHAMVSDSLARILSDENGTAGGFVRSTVASDLTLDGVDIQGPVDSLGADTVVVNSYFSPPSEYVYLTDVHGFGRALSDEIYLQTNLETPNGDTTYLVRDSAGNITAGDQDTVNISGVVPWNCTVESLTVFYVISTGSEIVDNWLRGPDKTTFNNLTDSIYLTNATDLTSTSWATQHYTASNFAALGGHRFSWKYIVQLDTDNDRLRIGWVRLKVRRAG